MTGSKGGSSSTRSVSTQAVLLEHHGVVTVGPSAEAAVKAAVMTEDVAATTFLALQLGTPQESPRTSSSGCRERYTKVYGQ